jgi:hypothetical protein
MFQFRNSAKLTIVAAGASRSAPRLVFHLHLAVDTGKVPVHFQYALQLLEFALFFFQLWVGASVLDLSQ